jgi:hypothetical protein
MISPTRKEGDRKYRFSRSVRLPVVVAGLLVMIAVCIAFAFQRDWDGVAFGIVGVFMTGGLVAQELGVGAWLTNKFPHAPVPRLLVSLGIVGLVAVVSRNTVLVVAVAGVLSASNLIHFWWARHRS